MYLCGNPYIIVFLYTAVELNSERGKKNGRKKTVGKQKEQTGFQKYVQAFLKNGNCYVVSPDFAVKPRPSRHLP